MKGSSFLTRGASLLIAIGAWWLVTSHMALFSPIVLPSPMEVLRAAASLAHDGDLRSGGLYEANLFGHILISLRRVLLAWLAAMLVAIPLGVVLGTWAPAARYGTLTVRILAQIPPIAYIPLAIVWFGLGETPILFIIFIGALWAMLVNVESGVRGVPVILVRAAQSQGASGIQIFWHVVLPAALPYIFNGMRISFGVAWVTIVASELIASSSGLGYLIEHARRILASADIIVGMICIGVLGVIFDAMFRAVESLVCKWK